MNSSKGLFNASLLSWAVALLFMTSVVFIYFDDVIRGDVHDIAVGMGGDVDIITGNERHWGFVVPGFIALSFLYILLAAFGGRQRRYVQ